MRFDTNNIPIEYSVEVSNRFAVLGENSKESCYAATASGKRIFLICAEKHVPPRKERRSKEWVSDESVKRTVERREMKAVAMLKAETYTEKNKEIGRSLKKDEENQIQGVCIRLEEQAQRHHLRDLFQTVKELSSTPPSRSLTIRASDGTVLTEEAEIRE